MLPHIYGFIPYTFCWVVYFTYFYTSIDDAAEHDPSVRDRIPDWVPIAIISTVAVFTSFTFVQWRYQRISPDRYWETEIWYGLLSLSSKMLLGGLIYMNVLRFASFDEAVAPTA